MKPFIIGILLLAVGLGGGFWYKHHGPGANKPLEKAGKELAEKAPTTHKVFKPVAVTVAPVTHRRSQRLVKGVGSLYGQEEITITPKVEGRILNTLVDVGDRVKPGDLLLIIDDTDFLLAESEAQKALELELSKVGLKTLPQGPVDVNQIPLVVRAGFLEKNSQIRKDRLFRLGGTTSPEEREQADTENRVANANYRQAILDAQTTLASAQLRQAQLNTAKQRLADTKVRIPEPKTTLKDAKIVEYAVTQRLVTQGELLKTSPSTSMSAFKLVIDNPLKLQAAVPERHLSEVRLGQLVDLEVESYRGRIFQGTVARINPSIDRINRTFQIEVDVPNMEKLLHSGSFAKASIQTRVDEKALTVPEESVLNYAGVVKVFVVREGKAVEVPVETGVRMVVGAKGQESAWVEVMGDLKVGEMVVTSGQSQLHRGREVRIRKPIETFETEPRVSK
ncbi:MAG: efflux RND transporter periplasmic adaptor subunit [Gemmataceae bacterium]|nr:efflux RND transporter periplasmic adaptor subunit [Gemmataceae bacterium]